MRKEDTKTNSNYAYIAGLFDIGGCIKIETTTKGTKPSLLIWITSKNFKLMEYLQKFGANIGQKTDGQFRAKWRDDYAYRTLNNLMPFLKVRQDQATIGLEFMEYKKRNPEETNFSVYILRLKLTKRSE